MSPGGQPSQVTTVTSSAGAGKTYNLAAQYLRLLLFHRFQPDSPGSDVSSIVAITFTNKAAAEMRSRIIEWMKRIILDLPFEGSQKTPMDEIFANLPEGASHDRSLIRSLVSSAFEQILRNFYAFKVGTIDSFVHLILRASAFRLNLPPDFEVSTDSTGHMEALLQECLQRILEERPVREDFDRFLSDYMAVEGPRASWVPTSAIREAIFRFWNEEAKENREFRHPPSPEEVGAARSRIRRAAEELIVAMRVTAGLKVNKQFQGVLEKLVAGDPEDFLKSRFLLKPTLQECLNQGSAPVTDDLVALWREMRQALSLFCETAAASKFRAYLGIYSLFKTILRTELVYKKQVVLIDELNRLLQRVVTRNEFIPEIFYTLASRYSHFLIDEFQDTNHLQWRNIEVLAAEALAKGGTLFLVGDKKQAIYRWRGGRAELVDHVALRYRAYGVDDLVLSTNFRSGEVLVTFFNRVFDRENLRSLCTGLLRDHNRDGAERVLAAYRNSRQETYGPRLGTGYVRVERITEEDEEGHDRDVFSKEERFTVTEERFKDLIRELLETQGRNEEDVAVLVRTREEAEFIVQILLQMGLPVESEITVNIKNNALVNEMVSFLFFLDRPDDDVAFAAFVTGQIFSTQGGPDREDMRRLIEKGRLAGAGQPLYLTFSEAYPSLWSSHFEPLFRKAGYLPLYDLLVLFIKRWQVLARFPDEAPFVLHLCELAKGTDPSVGQNLSAFLGWWSGEAPQGVPPQERETPFLLKTVEGSGALKVMTIHKAKGLQFPLVILPFVTLAAFGSTDGRNRSRFVAEDKGGDHLRLLWVKHDFTDHSAGLREVYDRAEEQYVVDELNNLYVAFTRAEEELYIFLSHSGKRKNRLIDYIFGLDGLKGRGDESRLALGRQRGREKRVPSDGAERLFNLTVFDDKGPDLGWMSQTGAKFEPLDRVSPNRIRAKRKGDVVHYILSLIETLGEEDRLDEWVERGVGRFSVPSYRAAIRETLSRLLSLHPVRPFFVLEPGDRAFREKEIVDGKGQTHKVDRIVLRRDRVEVLDFKTGESHGPEHEEQVRTYGALVGALYPGKIVKRFLLYVDEGALYEV